MYNKTQHVGQNTLVIYTIVTNMLLCKHVLSVANSRNQNICTATLIFLCTKSHQNMLRTVGRIVPTVHYVIKYKCPGTYLLHKLTNWKILTSCTYTHHHLTLCQLSSTSNEKYRWSCVDKSNSAICKARLHSLKHQPG
jgi:hypothetical protein